MIKHPMHLPSNIPTLLCCPVLLLASCASSDSRKLLEQVRQDAKGRTGADLSQAKSADALLRKPLTADAAAQIALANNGHLRATLEELGISQAEFALMVTPQNPSLAVSLRFTSPGRMSNPEFGLTQEVLDLLLRSTRKKFAQNQLDQARLRITRAVVDLNFETREAFYMLQGEENLLQRLKAVGEVQKTAADLAGRLHDAGNINELELKSQQSGSLDVELEIKKATAQVQSRREKLQRLLGVRETNWRVSPQLPELPRNEPSLGRLEQYALAQRLDLAMARSKTGQSVAALNLKNKTRLIPGLKLGVDTERDPDGTQFTGPTADIEIPLFNRGRAEVAKLSAEQRQASEELAALENDIRSQVREAYATLKAAREAAEFARTKVLPNQQELLRDTLLHYNAMQKSSFELLAAKERETRAERNTVEAVRDYWLAQVALERAVGGRIQGSMNSTTPSLKASTAKKNDVHHHASPSQPQ